jgi:hypothetical protein
MKADGLEPLVETPDDVEDERAVGDGLAEVAEVLCLALVEPAIVGDGEVTLTEGAEVGVGVQGAMASQMSRAEARCSETVSARSSVMVPKSHVHLVGGGWDGDIRQNVALQGVVPEGEEEGLAPPGVEGRRAVEAERNQEADVLDGDGL